MAAADTPTATRTLDEVQRYHILEVLRQSGGVVGGCNGAAVRLGLARGMLQYRIRKLVSSKRESFKTLYDEPNPTSRAP
jgi:transcriptional regulator with GAF, ATPase, and Fis domain